ncbi:hypothetical protein OLZ71_003317 [Vibrio parahaemolyticus]|nr:hypothetical protein [Vibrio parahaemolyticus]HAS7012697.1 hypothetical protein [Vibrio parahaemolyticus]
MKKFLKEKLKIDLDQPSTKKGLALLGAGAALLSGHPELLTASISNEGVQIGGVVGSIAPIMLGFYEALRDEQG